MEVHLPEMTGGRPAPASVKSRRGRQSAPPGDAETFSQDLKTLHEISLIILGAPDLRAVLEGILDKTLSITGFDIGNIRLLNSSGELEPVVSRGYRDPGNLRRHTRRASDANTGMFAQLLNEGRAQVVADVPAFPGLRTFKREGAQSVIVIPVRTRDEVLGAIQVGSRKPHAFSPGEIRLLEAIGVQMGIGVQKMKLFQATERHAEELAALNRVTAAISSTNTPDEILRPTLDAILEVTGMEAGYIRFLEGEPSRLTLKVHRGVSPAYVERLRRGAPAGGKSEQVLSTRRSLVFDRILEQPGNFLPETTREGFTAAAWIPVVSREQGVGVIVVATRRGQTFPRDQISVLESIGSVLGVAIERGRLYTEALEQTSRLEGLIRTSARVAGSLQLKEVLRSIAEEAANLLGMDGAVFRLLQGDQLMMMENYGVSTQISFKPALRMGESLAGRVAQEGRPLAVPDLREDDACLPEHRAAARMHGLAAYLGVPLRYQNRIIGVLSVVGREARRVQGREVTLLSAFADHAAIAIEKARLFEERRRVEDEIRRLNAQLEQRVVERTAQLGERERDLSEAKAFLENMIAASPGILFRVDPTDFSLDYISPNVRQILGYAPEEILKVPGFRRTRVHPDDRERVGAVLAQALAQRHHHVEFEHRFQHKDGRYQWFYVVERLEYDDAGTLTRVFGYAMDITERKRAEEAIRQTKEEAEKANQAKSEFLSRMSHELRTPLNAILGFAQLLEMDTVSSEEQESLAHILKAGKHLLELVNELLDIGQIESGRLAVEPEPVQLGQAVQESLTLIASLAAERRVTVVNQSGEMADRHLLADRQRLKQVLLNLLSNAVKYNREGGTVILSCAERSPARLRISIMDTGRGIAPEMRERLFIPFERLDAREQGVEGTGIGLALSKRLVMLMGGDIGVESAVGQGSTFWVDLPLSG